MDTNRAIGIGVRVGIVLTHIDINPHIREELGGKKVPSREALIVGRQRRHIFRFADPTIHRTVVAQHEDFEIEVTGGSGIAIAEDIDEVATGT